MCVGVGGLDLGWCVSASVMHVCALTYTHFKHTPTPQTKPNKSELKCTWTNVVKLGQSLYREAPGMDVYRPKQKSPVQNFYLAGSYTYQVGGSG